MGGDAWTIGLAVVVRRALRLHAAPPTPYGLEALAIASLPVAFAAAGQAIVVISGGIDLSIGSVIALTNVIAAVLLLNAPELSVPIVVAVLLIGILIGLVNGGLVVISRVPDIVVTLSMLFVWAGAALLVLPTPGGDSVPWLDELTDGGLPARRGAARLRRPVRHRRARMDPASALPTRAVPLRHRLEPARGVPQRGERHTDEGRSPTPSRDSSPRAADWRSPASTGIGQPLPGPYLLLSVAAIVLGGVSLAGGRGGLLGPIIGIFILGLIRADLLFLGVEPAFSTVVQGVIMVVVVMLGAFVTLRRRTA